MTRDSKGDIGMVGGGGGKMSKKLSKGVENYNISKDFPKG